MSASCPTTGDYDTAVVKLGVCLEAQPSAAVYVLRSQCQLERGAAHLRDAKDDAEV
jgi:hypothetical protein